MWEASRNDRVYGSREDLIRELMRLADGWEHLGNQRKLDECTTGILGLQSGYPSVTVGHAEFVVEVADITTSG